MKKARSSAAHAKKRAKPVEAAPKPSVRSPATPLHLELAEQLEGLPRDVGIVLLGVGTVGVLIPGPIPPGLSFVVLGALFLLPRLVARFGGWMARAWPFLFRVLIGLIERLRTGLQRRFPGSIAA